MANGWSPEQIAKRLQINLLDDKSMRISHEAIYQGLYIQGEGLSARACELTAHRASIARAESPRGWPATGLSTLPYITLLKNAN
ncbi:hypothetical protein PS880_06169 [Pseudomonas fluorescens]|uniref:Uncharacterized protein n=1 Tax=Pseudomonas fluorescens TaxID=294 RepID=A0A5E7QNU9_PSEFL|nr:hypothetical protein PS880_06169 [Pseudomonas fluorescens]